MENNLNKSIKYYNLTIPQENIWTVEQLNPNTNINNILRLFFYKEKA